LKAILSRRLLLAGAGRLGAVGTLPALFTKLAHADAADESAILLSLLYPNSPDAKFNTEHFRDKHIPLLHSVYGESIERIELCTPHVVSTPKSFPAGQGHTPSAAKPVFGPRPSPVLAAARIWIRDVKEFVTRTSASHQDLQEGLAQVSDATPTAQYERVVDIRGDARSAVEVGNQVSSTWFPTMEGKTFDAKYYDENVVPQMVKLYGAKAIRRVELSLGAVQDGVQPPLKAAVHYYIRDRAAWDAAAMKAGMQLMAEGPKYTTTIPFFADMEVAAVG
jgi:hypothetical protein